MAVNHVEEFRGDLKEFHEMTEKFYRKEITVPEYKAFSGGFGSYAQRGGEASMLRLRLPGGEINKENLKFVADSMKKYGISRAHFTTCQTVQLHDLSEKTVCSLIEEAFEHGIITRGGGGDFPRNVMCSPLSGVAEDEYFDVLPYAKEAGDYLLGFIKKVKLPRKLKVCFSNREQNETHATFRDLGFVAKENQKFDVYIAGGLGIKPKMGVKVLEDIEPSNVLYCVKTMVDIFTKYGNYENRAASRSRFLQDSLGVEELRKVFKQQYEENLKTEQLAFKVTPQEIKKQAAGTISHNRVIPQKQKDFYTVSYHPIGGVVGKDFFETLNQTIADMNEVKVRITPDEGIYVINLTAEEATKVLSITEDGAENQFERSVACIGATTCQVGIGDSQALLQACIERVRQEKFEDGILPAIHISGCPSSCGTHQIGTIGFRGGKKPSPDGPKFSFTIYDNGCDLLGQEHFGEEMGAIYADDIPEFLVDLGKAVKESGLKYEEFRAKHPDKWKEILEKYI